MQNFEGFYHIIKDGSAIMFVFFKRIKAMPQGAKASIAFFIASLVTKGIGYITTPLFTRLLSAEEFGQVSVYLTWLQVFGIVAMFCLSYGVFNNGMVDYPEQRDEYSFSMLMLSNVISLCFSGILLSIYPWLQKWIDMDLPLLILMCVIFIFQPAYNFWTAKQRYELKYRGTVFWTILSSLLSPIISIICILFFDNHRLYARLFGAEVALIFIYVVFYIYLGIKAKWKLNTSFWKAAFLFNLPLIPHYLSTYLLGSSNNLLISAIAGDSSAAYYSVAYSVAAVVTIVWTSINATLIPFTYEHCKTKDYKSVSNITLPILAIFATACFFLIMLAPELVAIMATSEYLEAIFVIPPTIGGIFFQVQYHIYANIIYYYKKPKYVMCASILATITNLLLNFVCISKFGYLAAGYVTMGCYLLQATIDYFAMRRVVGNNVYNMRLIGLLSLIVLGVSFFSNLLYGYILVRYIIIIGILIFAILFRKSIFSLLKIMKKNNS